MYVGITFPFEHGLITRWQTLWKLYDYRNLTNSRNVSSLRAQWCAVWCSRALNQVEMLELRMPLVPQNRSAKCNMQRVRSRAQRTTRVAGEWMWRPYAPLSCKESGESEGNVFRGGKYIFITRWWVLLMYQSIQKPPIPPPSHRAIPGHLTRVKLRTVGNLTQNEARPVGHLTFVSKRLLAVVSKRISQFFDSAGEPRSRVIALVDSTWVFCCCRFI